MRVIEYRKNQYKICGEKGFSQKNVERKSYTIGRKDLKYQLYGNIMYT